MLSLKYIRIRKERPVEQCLSSIWREACADFGIPCVLIYLDNNCAYISASLKNLPDTTAISQNAPEIQEKLLLIQIQYAQTAKGYWKHSDQYYTFDCIPQEGAKEAAAAIFEVLNAYLPRPEIKVSETDSLNALEETPA